MHVTDGQRLLTELPLLLPRLLLINWATSELISLEGAKLQLRVKVEAGRAGLRPGLPVATEVELPAGIWIGVEAVGARADEGLLGVAAVCRLVLVVTTGGVRRWGVGAVAGLVRRLLGTAARAGAAAAGLG